MKSQVAFVLLAACSSSPPARPVAPPVPEVVLRPQPGADLVGPVAPPAAAAPAHRAPAAPLDLGKDRPPVAVELPEPPRGGAASFSFGDSRHGWVTRVPEANQLPAVAYGDGRVYVSGGFESVSMYALDAQDGHVVWASQQLEDNGPTAPSFEDGRLIFNTESCTLFVMDGKTGKKLWFKTLGDPTLAQPAVAEGLVFASHPCDSGQCLSAYRLASGDEVWTHDVGAELLAAPIVHDDSVYATNLNGTLFRFARKSGKLRWSRGLRATSAPWIDGDRLYLARRAPGGRAEQQIVVSVADGKVVGEQAKFAAAYLGDVPATMEDWKKVWAFEGSRPVVQDGVKYEAMGGVVQAGDPLSGDAQWQRRIPGAESRRSLGSVALAGAQVVVSSRDGKLYGLDVDTGYTLWAYDLHKTIVAEPVVARGWVYASTTDGTVVALNVADSSLDGWHMWGGNAQHDGVVAVAAQSR